MEILKDLNTEQKKAVECIEGPMLIVAGAGSGKTRVLTSRIAYLIQQGVPADRILALTFTKKAAGEMKERIALMVGEREARRLWMGTFHSVFIRFLREFSDVIGFPPTFTIYDTTDSVSCIKTCIKQLSLDDKVYKPKEVLSRISKAKNDLVTPTPYMQGAGGYRDEDVKHKKPDIHRIYTLYCQTCQKAGVMDFDDILLYMNVLFKRSPEALGTIAGRFSHILVDEYQDTNMAQYLILRKLAAGHQNICVVGDDSQSIYGFRGAQIQNILNFQKDFPKARLFRLERNYRSTQTIVNAANSLIAHNEGRIPKNCVSMGEEGEKIHIVHSYKGDNEAEEIAYSIADRIRSERCEYNDFAVLYRTNSQSRIIEQMLRTRNIPYAVFGNSFYDRLEVKDVIAYFKLCVNPRDAESFKRVINKPTRGIGDTSMASLAKAADAHGCSLFEAAFYDDLENYGLKNAAIQKIRAFCMMIKQYADQVSDVPAMDIARGIIDDSGLYLYYKTEAKSEGNDRLQNVEEVLNAVASKQEAIIEEAERDEKEVEEKPVLYLSEFLEDIALLSSIDNEEKDKETVTTIENKVKLMTIHTAKGLEFAHVFVPGMEENIFPSGGWMLTPSDLEEERRLFYVAMTRAKKTLTLMFATERFRNGKTEYNSPSRFLRELAPQYLDKPLRKEDFESRASVDDFDDDAPRGFRWSGASRWSPKPAQPVRPAAPARSVVTGPDRMSAPKPPIIDANFVPDPMTSFKVGDRIEHNRFGEGKVLEISGNVPDLKAKIVFDKYGEKLLLLKFAKIRHK
jgi:DNA helicase-2/ATP-dependent DNA helicase PcrA